MKIPFFKLKINEDLETGVDVASFVEAPATMKDFVHFNEDDVEIVREVFNEEEMIVTGVMMSAGTPIYRNDKTIGPHYVIIDAETIKKSRERFHKLKYTDSVSLHHNGKKVDGVYLIESYLVDPVEGPTAPLKLQQTINKGTWIVSYKCENKEVWADIKAKRINGISIEGFFERVPITVNQKLKNHSFSRLLGKDNNMKNVLLNFAKDIKALFEEEIADVELAMVATEGGLELNYEGELAIGTVLTILADGESVPAPEGAHVLTGEMAGVSLVVDVDGVIIDIVDEREAPEDAPEDEAMSEEAKKALNEAAQAMAKQVKFLKEENKTLKAESEKAKEEAKATKEIFEAQLKDLFERLKKVEETPSVEPTKTKFKVTEVKKTTLPQNPIANSL